MHSPRPTFCVGCAPRRACERRAAAAGWQVALAAAKFARLWFLDLLCSRFKFSPLEAPPHPHGGRVPFFFNTPTPWRVLVGARSGPQNAWRMVVVAALCELL